MSTATDKIFKTNVTTKVIFGLMAFVGAFAGAFLAGGKVPLAMPFGIAIAIGLMLGQKITVSDTEMVLKQGFKTMKFPFAGTVFRVEKRTGMASYFSSLRAESYLLHAAVPGKKKVKIAFILSAADSDNLLAALKEKATVTA